MKRVIVTIATVALCHAALAQQPTSTLTFDDALGIALENNPSIEASHYEEQAARRVRLPSD